MGDSGQLEDKLKQEVQRIILEHHVSLMQNIAKILDTPSKPVPVDVIEHQEKPTAVLPYCPPAAKIVAASQQQAYDSPSPNGRLSNLAELEELVWQHRYFDCHKYLEVFGMFGYALSWWERRCEPPRSGLCKDIVDNRFFQQFIFLVIAVNCIYTVLDTDWHMQHLTDKRTFPNVERVFLLIFCAELSLRLVVHRLYYFINEDMKWNIFDFLIIVLGVTHEILTFNDMNFVNPFFCRMLRVLRVSKKVSQLFRILPFFSELKLIVQCVVGSMSSLLCSFSIMLGFTCIFAVVLVQQMAVYLIENQHVLAADHVADIHKNFGSVARASLCLFQCIAGGTDWGTIYDMVQMSGTTAASAFVIYIVLVWFALQNIITSIFVDRAMHLAQPEVERRLLAKHKENLNNASELRRLFTLIDSNHSGHITLDEFRRCMQDERVASFFDIKGLPIHDVEVFFHMLASASGTVEVDIDMFISGCLRMRGQASNIDLLTFQYQNKRFEERMCRQMHQCQKHLEQLMQALKNPSRDMVVKSKLRAMCENNQCADSADDSSLAVWSLQDSIAMEDPSPPLPGRN